MTALPVHPVDLEPSFVADGVYATRRRYTRVDVAVALAAMVCLLDILPSRLVVPSLTAVGRPALVVALLLWCWWLMVRLNPRLVMVGPQPMRWVVLAYLLSTLVSYAIGFLRGLTPMESNGADRALLAAAEFTGVILMAADGLPNWERLKMVIRVLVYCSAFMGVVGLLQFITKTDVTRYLLLPGLQLQQDLAGFEERGAGFLRAPSTTTHYIEFSAVMALALPFAIHCAIFEQNPRRRRRFIVCALLIAAAVPVTLSRTGIVAVAVVMLVMLPIWGWRMRYNILSFTVGLLVVFASVKPGLIGTLKSLFTGASDDPSVQGRTERYGLVGHYFAERPWFGRGTGTWIPPMYQILDNQWLGTALSTGIVGVTVVAVLHISAIALAGIALRRSTAFEDRHLCVALIAVQLAAILIEGTFDAFAFSTYVTTFSLLTGFAGTVWRFTHPARTVRTSAVRRYVD